MVLHAMILHIIGLLLTLKLVAYQGQYIENFNINVPSLRTRNLMHVYNDWKIIRWNDGHEI